MSANSILSNTLDTIPKISNDIINDIKNDFNGYVSDPSQIFENFKSFAIQVLNTTEKVLKDIAIFYPKTFVICSIASIIFSFLSLSFFAIINIAINAYYLTKLKHHINHAIDVYEKNRISELKDSYETKRNFVLEIQVTATCHNLFDRIANFFHRT